MKTFSTENISTDKVCERRGKLKNHYVQLKLFKILSNQCISPKIVDIVMDWVKEYFTTKESVSTPQNSGHMIH